ncbi:MAG: hypothetical protein JF614_07280 [Acidobacteria bacterium]|nr:hypothetical protein [Acidobacteriota bacterium]
MTLPPAPGCVRYIENPERFPAAPRTPVHRQADTLRLLMLAQPTLNGQDTILTVPDALGINGDTQIGLARANRILPPGLSGSPVQPSSPSPCSLCGTLKGKPESRPSEVRDNVRPFGPLLHKVVFSREHIEDLGAVTREAVRDSCERFYEIATSPVSDLDGLTIGLNFGEYARSGASQIHFHYQVAGFSENNFNAGDRLGGLCQAYRESFAGADYLSDYEKLLREAGLLIAENEGALAYSPISPRFKGEVQIMVKDPEVGNIVDTTQAVRDSLAELEHQTMLTYNRLGCAAFNEVWYMTRFSQENVHGQRLIISMAPRTSILAFYELSGNYVIDVLPWTAAETLRGAETPHFSL